jgi:hypothetical protein
MITAKRRARATIAFFMPRRLYDFVDSGLSYLTRLSWPNPTASVRL